MFNKTIKDLLKEKNKDIDIKNLTERGYVKVSDLFQLNKNGNLLDFLKESLNDEKDAHFLSRTVEEEYKKQVTILVTFVPLLLFGLIILGIKLFS
jgi:hypothetical protein